MEIVYREHYYSRFVKLGRTNKVSKVGEISVKDDIISVQNK